jgi:peptidoglycan/xylan/chitin deacetylase (PgdA/CDA1 family)
VKLLEAELDRWGVAGRCAEFWWRDDDAGLPRPQLDRLLGIAQDLAIPVNLAVVPATAASGLLGAAGAPPGVTVLQHGWAHVNHEPTPGLSELGDGRPAETVLEELAQGHARLAELFGAGRVPPVLVPPWHSISARIAARLPQAGIRCVSLLGPPPMPEIVPGVSFLNPSVELVRWASEPGFVGARRAVRLLDAWLRARRLGVLDASVPLGLLTHHWALDEDAFLFLEALGRLIHRHRAARWIRPAWPDVPAADQIL